MRNLEREAQQPKLKDKLSKIKLFLTDCDGVLTDGKLLWMGQEVGWNRFFHTRDGYAFKFLSKMGIEVGVVSGGDSLGLIARLDNLHVKIRQIGSEDKRQAYLDIKKQTGFEDHEILYIGDEHFDIPMLKKVGFSATVPEADPEVKEICDYITECPGGKGAVREVANLLRHAQGKKIIVEDF